MKMLDEKRKDRLAGPVNAAALHFTIYSRRNDVLFKRTKHLRVCDGDEKCPKALTSDLPCDAKLASENLEAPPSNCQTSSKTPHTLFRSSLQRSRFYCKLLFTVFNVSKLRIRIFSTASHLRSPAVSTIPRQQAQADLAFCCHTTLSRYLRRSRQAGEEKAFRSRPKWSQQESHDSM